MQTSLIFVGLVSAILFTVQAIPYPGPNPYANPMPGPMANPLANPMANPMAGPGPRPEPSCCGGGGYGCGLGLCECCGGTTCENGACAPIIGYADGFYGAPRVHGGYGNTFSYGR